MRYALVNSQKILFCTIKEGWAPHREPDAIKTNMLAHTLTLREKCNRIRAGAMALDTLRLCKESEV